MAKKKNNFPNSDETIMSAKDRRRIITGLCVASFTVYLTFAFVSYLFTWQIDQSTLDIAANQLFFNSKINASNWSGTLGAIIAHRFLYKWFGLPSFTLIVILAIVSLRLLKIKTWSIPRTIKLSIAYSVWASVALGYLFHSSAFAPGGLHGHEISEWLNNVIGKLGTGIILITLLFILLSLTFESFINRCIDFIKKMISPKINDTALAVDPNAESTQTIITKDTEPSSTAEPASATEDDSSKGSPEELEDTKSTENTDKQNHNQPTFEITTVYQNEDPAPNDPFDNAQSNLADVTSNIVPDGNTEPNTTAGSPTPETISNNEQNQTQTYSLSSNFSVVDTTQKDDVVDTANGTTDDVTMTVNVNVEEKGSEQRSITELGPYDPTLDLEHYKLPPLDLLNDYELKNEAVTPEELNANKDRIVECLNDYKIQIDKINATVGPTVTLYEIVPAKGIKISKIKNLSDDIALSLAALGIRIIAPIPGRGTIGIEVPNTKPQTVAMRSVLASKKFQESNFELPVAIGKNISNETYVFDLTKTPHLLVAGATGQGKSVGLNAILASLLYKKHPAQLKFVLVDPKKVELTLYKKLEKYFLAKLPDAEDAIITDTQKVVNTLQSLCIEMDSRYELLKNAAVRNIIEYNRKFINRQLNPEKGHKYLPYIVVVIDEFADLIMTAGKEVELPIARLAQLARAIGIHLIIATQRPTTNIITGLIKANFPARIAFRVMGMVDSRTILDAPGANQLIGRGDMLIAMGSETTRVQCAFIDTPELEKVMEHIEQQQSYPCAFELPEFVGEGGESAVGDVDLSKRDALFEEAARTVVISQQGSTSLIQRKFSIGYNRAGRIIDQLEAAGIVGPFEGSKARQVLISDELSLDRLLETLQ